MATVRSRRRRAAYGITITAVMTLIAFATDAMRNSSKADSSLNPVVEIAADETSVLLNYLAAVKQYQNLFTALNVTDPDVIEGVVNGPSGGISLYNQPHLGMYVSSGAPDMSAGGG